MDKEIYNVKVVKFGGSSLADAEQFKKVGSIIMIEKISRFCLSIVSVSHKNFSCKSPIFLYLHWEWISSLSVYFFLHSRGLKYNQIILLLRGI